MKLLTNRTLVLGSLACGLALATSAHAQVSTGTPSGGDPTAPNAMGPMRSSMAGNSSYSLLPYTRRGYMGLNLGKPKFDTSCGTGLYSCDDPEVGGYLYTGGLVSDWVGLEVGYLYSGKADRAGGQTSAQGLNLSAVLRAPMGPFNIFAKGGGIYAQTKVGSDLLSGVTDGKRRGWGASYGFGAGFDFTPNSGVVLEWSRYRLRFPGGDRNNLDMTSVGYVHRF